MNFEWAEIVNLEIAGLENSDWELKIKYNSRFLVKLLDFENLICKNKQN